MKLCGVQITVEKDGDKHIITIPMDTVGANQERKEMHYQRAARVRNERLIVRTAMRLFREKAGRGDPDARYLVRLTRIAPRLLDDDNAIHAMKATRDMVAAGLDTDDGPDGRCKWSYAQVAVPKTRAVRIEVERVAESEHAAAR